MGEGKTKRIRQRINRSWGNRSDYHQNFSNKKFRDRKQIYRFRNNRSLTLLIIRGFLDHFIDNKERKGHDSHGNKKFEKRGIS